MKLITRGYGNNQQIITRGYGAGIIAQIVEQAHGAAQYVIKETITIVRLNISHFDDIKLRFHIGKFTIDPFSVIFKLSKDSPRATFVTLVHHFDIFTRHIINTITTAIASNTIKTNENLSK